MLAVPDVVIDNILHACFTCFVSLAEVETEVAADAEAEQLRQLAEAQKVHQAIKAAVNKLPALK